MKRAGSARARGRAAMILDVQRRIAMASLSVPLAGAGWLTAHSVAYELAEPDSHDRAKVLSATGHGYLEFEPLFIACGFVLMVAGLFASVTEGIRDRPHARPPSRLFALTPVLAFVVLEHVERLAEHGSFPYDLALEPTFLVGLVLQLPFAVAALSFSHALHALAHALGHLLRYWARPGRPFHATTPPLALAQPSPDAARPLPLALVPGSGPRALPAARGV